MARIRVDDPRWASSSIWTSEVNDASGVHDFRSRLRYERDTVVDHMTTNHAPVWPSDRVLVSMNSEVNIPPNTSARITARPRGVSLRLSDILISGQPSDWVVEDIRIGGRPQCLGIPGVDLASASFRTAMRRSFDVVWPAMEFSMLVRFVGANGRGAPFICTAIGSSVDDQRASAIDEMTQDNAGAREHAGHAGVTGATDRLSAAAMPQASRAMTRDRDRTLWLSSSPRRVLPNERIQIVTTPCPSGLVFHPRRIVIRDESGALGDWIVNDVTIGAVPQLSGRRCSGINGLMFGPDVRIHDMIALKTMRAGEAFAVTVTYVGDRPDGMPFVCSVPGTEEDVPARDLIRAPAPDPIRAPIAVADPMAVRHDGVTLRDLLLEDGHRRRESKTRGMMPMSPAQREAVSAHWSAQLRAKVADAARVERERVRVDLEFDADE